MSKPLTIYYVRLDTQIFTGRSLGNALYIGFDFEPTSRKKMIGLACNDPEAARAMSKYFLDMAKALEKKRGKT